MKIKGLNFLQKLTAYLLFISIVIRFIACQLSKDFLTERQVKEFRYYSFAGFIGILIAICTSLIDSVPNSVILYVWVGFFIAADLLEKKLHLSKVFEE